jgi:predicted RNase H-related nuclease YkuK (DUF458 family)
MLAELASAGDLSLHVGSDSKNRGDHTYFVMVIAIQRPGEGWRVLYRALRERRMNNLAERLFREAHLSIELATLINTHLPRPIVVHIDANPDERHRSSRYARSLAGMGRGSGFEVRLKPDAWCASCVADHVVKGKHVRAA